MYHVFLLSSAVVVVACGTDCGFSADNNQPTPKNDPLKLQVTACFKLPRGTALSPQQQQVYSAFCDSVEPDLRVTLKRMQETKKQPKEWSAASQHFQQLRQRIRQTQDMILHGQGVVAVQPPVANQRGAQVGPAIGEPGSDDSETLLVPWLGAPTLVPWPTRPWPPTPVPTKPGPPHKHDQSPTPQQGGYAANRDNGGNDRSQESRFSGREENNDSHKRK